MGELALPRERIVENVIILVAFDERSAELWHWAVGFVADELVDDVFALLLAFLTSTSRPLVSKP